MLDLTPLARPIFALRSGPVKDWDRRLQPLQLAQLNRLLHLAQKTEVGKLYRFDDINSITRSFKPSQQNLLEAYQEFRNRVAPKDYEAFRPLVMRMVKGETDVLWPGKCLDFAQSSGTSGGRSKFIPVTSHSLRLNHYPGSAYCVAFYLALNPASRLFSGKGFILGGSFASQLKPDNPRVKVGDLSATLISKIPFGAGLFRVPDKKTALMVDWEQKLPALAQKAAFCDITNISGVPSWFYTVIRKVCELRGVDRISDVWPNLEVFFHGGISFSPYRELYRSITDPAKMHYLETYNASEGFFAAQNDFDDPAMMLLLDVGIFFEFLPISALSGPLAPWEVEQGKVYELVITAPNGLWRYRTGDTVRVENTSPLKIKIVGRTRSFINAFGEELMEDNAERAIAEACAATGAEIRNYTAAPLYTESGRKGCHQWAVEWVTPPASNLEFADVLDKTLRALNSDYDAKRDHSIFLDSPQVISLPDGTFERWLHSVGNHKLGGQRKVPRLSNDRHILDAIGVTA